MESRIGAIDTGIDSYLAVKLVPDFRNNASVPGVYRSRGWDSRPLSRDTADSISYKDILLKVAKRPRADEDTGKPGEVI